MNLREKRLEQPVELNLISLVDVMFTLLLFFVLTTTFDHRADIVLKLPTAGSARPAEERGDVDITIDAEGNFFVAGRPLVNAQLETLQQAVRTAAQSVKEPNIIISADARTPHQSVVTAMDAARRLGFYRVTIATSAERSGAPVDAPAR